MSNSKFASDCCCQDLCTPPKTCILCNLHKTCKKDGNERGSEMCKFLVWHWIKKFPFSAGEILQMEGIEISEEEVERLCDCL